MAKSRFLCLFLGLIALAASAEAQSTVYLLEAPAAGMIQHMPASSALVYVGTTDGVDAFSVGTEDANGFSQIDVAIVDGTALVRNTDCGGPLALSATTLVVSGGKESPTPPAGDSSSTPAASDESSGSSADPEREQPESGKAGKDDDTKIVVIIRVDQPGKGGDRDPYEGGLFSDIDVGHTYLEIINGPADKSTSIGFYPNGGVSPWDPKAPGTVVDDKGHPWDVSYEIEITKEQYEKLMEQINKDKSKPPMYDLNTYNCTDYSLDLLDKIGIDINTKDGSWPGGGGSNPGDLGEDLEDLGGNRNSSTSANSGSSSK